MPADGIRLQAANGSPAYSGWVQINTLQIIPIADGAAAAYPRILDLHPVLGPSIQLVNTSGVPVAGLATVEIGGLVDN